MERSERFAKLQRLLRQRGGTDFPALCKSSEVSRATVYRDLSYMRDRLGVPWIRDPDSGRYCIDRGAEQTELPGLWFSAEEIHALLSMHRLLAGLDSVGLLKSQLDPLKKRLERLLESGPHCGTDIARRIHVLTVASRRCEPRHFQTVAAAVLERRRLFIHYAARSREEVSQREISPQRLTHYRNNWYIDAWCHLREQIRSFSVDAIRFAKTLPEPAMEIPAADLEATLDAGYGIFSGPPIHRAVLRFVPRRARWVAAEHWHADQQGRILDDGGYELTLPYSDDPELVMDILKYGPDCEVVEPAELREKVRRLLEEGARRYG